MKLLSPAGQQIADINGNVLVPDANGVIDIGTSDPSPFLASGCILIPDFVGATGARPTRCSPGDMFLDTTLNKPIWRDGTNANWRDATGAIA